MISGWAGFLLGSVSGMLPGLLFHNEHWLGGYGSWRRRMTRLGHISFFGIGLLNIAFSWTVAASGYGGRSGHAIASVLLLAAALTMPLLCYLSAWRPVFRHLFFIPVLSVTVAAALTLVHLGAS